MISAISFNLRLRFEQKGGNFMLDFTWKVFCMTGNIDTYLLLKEIESNDDIQDEDKPEDTEFDTTTLS